MKRTFLWCVLAAMLVAIVALSGCAGGSQGQAGGSGTEAGDVRIADERIIGRWSGADGDVEFRADGVLVLDDGTEASFAMPNSGRIDVEFAAGSRSFNITWDGDDRHGVLATDSTTTTPTWYARK